MLWHHKNLGLYIRVSYNVIELDGTQYFSDMNAYRSDRRKDVLLQENGYIVLGFLADNVGKQLHDILDCIFRALSQKIVV